MQTRDEIGYYRHPTIHGDQVAFVCEDDLWCVPTTGGTARRLTANPGRVTYPVYSPDGEWIAYTSSDDGPAEVFVIPAEGGAPRRLTWLGSHTQVVGWRPDGKSVVLATDRGQPFMKAIELHEVPLANGPVRPLRVGPARAITFEPGGAGVVIGRNSGDPARWKRYRGGTAGSLWIDRQGNGQYAPLVDLPGNLSSPMWIAARIYFLSDHEGFGNLYSCKPNGRDVLRHTDHEDFYARFPASDGTRIVYHAGANLQLFDPATATASKLAVSVRSARAQRSRRFVDPERSLETFDLHPQGHSLATVHRAGLFTVGLWEGAAVRHGGGSEVRHRLGCWLPDGRVLSVLFDQAGTESLYIHPVGDKAKAKQIEGDFGRPLDIVVAPHGDRVAVTNQRQEVIVVDTKRGTHKLLERSEFARIEGMGWSPDGRWLAYGLPMSHNSSSIRLWDSVSGQVTSVTRPEFHDSDPAFDPDGKYLYFLSGRIFDPVYDSQSFDLGFPKGSKPFLIPLRADQTNPFSAATRPPRAPSPDEGDDRPPGDPKGAKPKKKKGEPDKPEIPDVVVDFDGIEDRALAFPVPEGIYGRIVGLRNQVLFSEFPVTGSLDVTWMSSDEPLADGVIELFDFDKGRAELFCDNVSDFQIAMEAQVVGIRQGNRLRVVHSSFRIDRRPDRDEPAGRDSGWIDLDRLRVAVSPPEEWRQMFLEAWTLQRDHFWTSDMAGVDWKQVRDRYLPLVERCGSRAEFSDLLWEMQGELGTSHCYELGGDYRPEPDWFQGFLGADLELDEATGAWRVAYIPRGDSWDDKQSSPLAAPGINVAVGDVIVAVDGFPVGREVSPDERLVNLAGHEVQLTVARPPRSPARPRATATKQRTPALKTRTITIKTLRDEFALRYRDWVEANLARVHDESGGRVGYVHIPNMGPVGYAEFHRYFRREVDNDGLVIDVRWNGGGHVSQLLLEKLLRRRVGYDQPRWSRPNSYPTEAPLGPMVALTNEYAGSDGDIFSHCFKLYELGPLIGKRTWGGVVGIWPRHSLVDGTITTQAEFATWFEDVGWGVENYGVDPDIEVDIRPQDHARGADPQLERALKEIKKQLRATGSLRPKFDKPPQLAPGRLPSAGTGPRRKVSRRGKSGESR